MGDHHREVLELVGFNIRKARERVNVTQEQLAEEADIEWQTLSLLERGRQGSLRTICAVAEALEVSALSFFKPTRTTKRKVGRPKRKSSNKKKPA